VVAAGLTWFGRHRSTSGAFAGKSTRLSRNI
jgi:hypothetical protein